MTASHFRSRWLAVLVALDVIVVLNACGDSPAPTATRTPRLRLRIRLWRRLQTPQRLHPYLPMRPHRRPRHAHVPTNGDTCTCIYAHRIGYPHIRRGQGCSGGALQCHGRP